MIYGNDILFRKVVEDAEVDEDGDLVLHDAEWGEPEQCDAEPAQGKASTFTMPDGKKRKYNYVIVLDVDVEPFNVGDHIMLQTQTAPDKLREYEVLGFHRYKFQTKLWV